MMIRILCAVLFAGLASGARVDEDPAAQQDAAVADQAQEVEEGAAAAQQDAAVADQAQEVTEAAAAEEVASKEKADVAGEVLERASENQEHLAKSSEASIEASNILADEAARIDTMAVKMKKDHQEKAAELGEASEGAELAQGSFNAAALREHETSKKWVKADSVRQDTEEIMKQASNAAALTVARVDATATKVGKEREIVDTFNKSVSFMESAEKHAKEVLEHAETDKEGAKKAFDEASAARKEAMVVSEHKERKVNEAVAQKKQLDEAVKVALAAKVAADSAEQKHRWQAMEAKELLIGAFQATKESEEDVNDVSVNGLVQNEVGGLKAPKHLGHHHSQHQAQHHAAQHQAQHHAAQHQAQHHAAQHHAQHQAEHHAHHAAPHHAHHAHHHKV